MQATPSLDFIPTKPKELNSFAQMLQKSWRNLTTLINNKIGFGDGTLHDNIDGVWANVVAPAGANTDFTITHNLGRVPVGYWAMQKDRACDVYTGSVAATTSQITLRATVASAVLRLFIVGFILSFFCLSSFAQTTSVTLQVTDAGAQSWNNGTWSVLLVQQLGVTPSGPPFNLVTGGTVPNQTQSGSLNGTGGASMTLTQSSAILPALSQWQFRVCPAQGVSFQCFLQSFTIAGATQTVNITPPTIVVSCAFGVNAYADSEVNCGVGGEYFNLTSSAGRVCTASSGNTCSAWANIGGTGTGITSLNGLSASSQTFVNDTNVTVVSSGSQHTITWAGTLAKNRALATTVYTDQSNTFSTGTQDFSAVTLMKLRNSAGLTTSASGDFGFDTTNGNWHGWNGADLIFAPLASGFVSGHCGQPTTASGKWTIVDAGAACGSGSMTWPSTVGLVRWTSGTAWATSVNDTTALTGQVLTANNGSASTFNSTSTPVGNGGAAITASYTAGCDSATATVDRGKWLVLGASAVLTLPDLSGSGCSGMYGGIENSTSGSLTINRQTSDTFTVYGPNSGTPTTGATSFTLAAGQTASYSPDPTSTVYDIRISQPTAGAATPCTTTALSLQYNNGGAFGCLTEFTYASSTITSSAAGKVDLSAENSSTSFKVPVFAGATSGADGAVDYDSTAKLTHVRTSGADSIVVATIGSSDVLAQSTSQSAVTLASAPTAASYAIWYYASQNAVCTTGSNSVNFTFNWTDAGSARSLTTGSLPLGTAQVASGYLSGEFPIFVNSGNVTYTSTVNGTCASGTSSYDIHASIERKK
jgi:hypothetical protein